MANNKQLDKFQLRVEGERRVCFIASIFVPAFLGATFCYLHSTSTTSRTKSDKPVWDKLTWICDQRASHQIWSSRWKVFTIPSNCILNKYLVHGQDWIICGTTWLVPASYSAAGISSTTNVECEMLVWEAKRFLRIWRADPGHTEIIV